MGLPDYSHPSPFSSSLTPAQVEQYLTYILDHQTSEGWLGPDDIEDGNMYWSKFPILLSMRMYYEATGNRNVLLAMFRFLHVAYQRMFSVPLGNNNTWYV